jgi:pimeloyl-ACP methyl ester carboxylesterase
MFRWLALAGLTLLALAAGAIVLLAKGKHKDPPPPPPRPSAFYVAPHPLPHGPPGTLIRSERLRGLPRSEKGWRILYVSHGYDRHRTAVSGLVIVPNRRRPKTHRRVVVFAHGTTGVIPRCAPSVLGAAATAQIDGLRSFIHDGDAVVIPDYEGLGTPGPHPYLIGKTAARNAIDAVRATHKIHAIHAGRRYAVFGESQGGQAAIAIGQLAPQYGRGLDLVGIAAAGAPVSLASLFSRGKGTRAGDTLAAYTLSSWAKVYDRPKLLKVLTPASRRALKAIDATCVTVQSDLGSAVPSAVARQIHYVHKHPTHTKAWSKLLRKNSLRPFATDIPLLFTQGADDELVVPEATEDYIRALCERADTVAYRIYPKTSHDEIGSSSAAFTVGWIAGRFAGREPPDSCPS